MEFDIIQTKEKMRKLWNFFKKHSLYFSFQKHEESHTRHQIYGCPWCDKKFTLYNSRRTHVTRDHPLELQKQREMRKLQRIPTNIQNT